MIGLMMSVMPLFSHAQQPTPETQQTVNKIVNLSTNMADLSILLNNFLNSFEQKPVAGFLTPDNHPKQTCVNQKLRNTSGFRDYQAKQAMTYINQHGLATTNQQLAIFRPELVEALGLLNQAINSMITNTPVSAEMKARMKTLMSDPALEQDTEKLVKEYKALGQLMGVDLLGSHSENTLKQYIQWGLSACQVDKTAVRADLQSIFFKN